jgi:hypothetical protein
MARGPDVESPAPGPVSDRGYLVAEMGVKGGQR